MQATPQTGSALAGRNALVTGAGSGIGAATAMLLADRGAGVCCADRNEDTAEKVAAEIVARGGRAFAIGVDVRSEKDNARAVEATVEQYGGLNIAFFNAGMAMICPVTEMDLEDWERVIGVHVTGTFLGIKHAAPAIGAAGGGSIIAMSSVGGVLGGAGASAYSAAKHAILGLVKCAAVDLAPLGIRVNAVCPGAIDTPILGPLHGNAEFLAKYVAPGHPIGRVGRPEEVAAVVGFLAGDDSSFMTGAGVAVDGGASASVPQFKKLSESISG